MARREYSEDVKAAALVALQAGDDPALIAERYNIPVGTVYSWASRLRANGEHHGETITSLANIASNQREHVGTLVIEYLSTSLRALRAQADVFSDTEWIKKQNASDLAILHGTIGDRAVRLLEALGSPDAPTPVSDTSADH